MAGRLSAAPDGHVQELSFSDVSRGQQLLLLGRLGGVSEAPAQASSTATPTRPTVDLADA